MSKRKKEELNDDIGLISDTSGDDLSDVKKQLKKLQKDSADPDEDESGAVVFEDGNETEVSEAVSEDIVVHEEFAGDFLEEDKYYKALDKFNKDMKIKEDKKQ